MPSLSEARTRIDLIEPALRKAGWDVYDPDQVGIEIPVDGLDPQAWKALEARLRHIREAEGIYDVPLPKGVSDYALYRPNGEIVAIVEAKRTSTDPRLAEAQAEFYVTEIEKQQHFRPFAFMTNGHDVYFWDVSRANKRLVAGFFSPADLENLLYLRENGAALTHIPISTAITDRAYQQEAIRRVCEAFERGRRKALIVMATGTGKTRVAMSLVDIFLRADQARHILFVADRDALVEQARVEGFQDYVPSEPCTRIHTGEIDRTSRLYVVTLQTLSRCFEQFTPAFFDLIVFAMTQAHALRLADVFEEMYPQYPGLVQVITCQSEYRGTLIDRFKKESLPRIAISVDMLESGVNVPEAVNLVFMRPVHSRIKLEQMIGRGTRTHETCTHPEWLPDGHKREFQVIDFWENDFSKRPEEQAAQSLPVLVAIFNTRLRLLELFLADETFRVSETLKVCEDLRAMVALIPTDAFSVRRTYPEIKEAWEDGFWRYLTPDRVAFLRFKVGPLLRYAPGVDVQAATFVSKVERLKLQVLTGQDARATAQSIAEDVARLPAFVYEEAGRARAARLCLTPHLQTASVAQLNEVIDALADQMRNRRERPSAFLTLDLPDFVEMRGYILLYGGSQPVYVEEYRRRVEERVLGLAASHPTVEAIARGEPVGDEQLIELERTLRQELGGGDLELTEENVRKAYGLRVGSLLEFLRRLLEIEGIPDYREIVRRRFEGFMAAHPFNADQMRFLRAVQNVFLQRKRLALPDLYAPPLTSFGQDAVERWFTPDEVNEVLAFVNTLTIAHRP